MISIFSAVFESFSFSGNPWNDIMFYLADQHACQAIQIIITDPRVISFIRTDGSEVHFRDLVTPSLNDCLNEIALLV